jgi:L-arabinokinase
VVIAFYISGHGFGHVSRQIELMHALRAERPDVRLVVRTAAARWLFDTTAPPGTELHPAEVDTGLVQIDSLNLDEEATARAAARFYADFDAHVAREANFLRAEHANLVVADVPPLAFPAAERAGVPSVAVANFTWDWIYNAYEAFPRTAPHAIPTIRRAYATATETLRLPMHGGFETMPAIREVPLVARRSRRDPADTRRALGVDGSRPLVLVSFGGYGLTLPLDELRRAGDLAIVAPEREPPAGLRYEDLVAAADVVVSKPGYGIVSECIANQTALLYTSRGRFAEYDVFVAEMPKVLRCRFLAQDDLIAGRWRPAIDALLAQPAPPEHWPTDGAAVVARALIESVRRYSNGAVTS